MCFVCPNEDAEANLFWKEQWSRGPKQQIVEQSLADRQSSG